MIRTATLSVLSCIVLAATAAAQTIYIPDDKFTGSCNVAPFGVPSSTFLANQRYQQMATFADLGSPTGPITIQNIGFAACDPTEHIQHHDSITITLAQTDATSLTANFASNLEKNVVVVLDAKDYQWRSSGTVWRRIGLARNYVFDPSKGKNLVFEVCVLGSKKVNPTGGAGGYLLVPGQRVVTPVPTATSCVTTGLVTSGSLRWCFDIGSWSLGEYGLGCQNLDLELSGSAELGKSLTAKLNGAPGTGTCFMAAGFDAAFPVLDLDLFGAKGCKAYTNPLVFLAGKSHSATVPNRSSLLGQRHTLQFYCLDQGFPGGVATSEVGVVIPGRAQ